MLARGIKIHFAHRTFSWDNEAKGKAAVHCVIIGFGLQDVSPMVNGSKPTDGGNLILSVGNKADLISKEPQAALWIKPFAMGEEFINGVARYCLWLVDCPPKVLRTMPEVLKRVEAFKTMRLANADAKTRKDADSPTLFQKIRQPKTSYLALPRVSSERRAFIPIAYASSDLIAGDKLQTIPNASLYEFGVITNCMHMAWMRTTAGRLKSDFQFSAKITYNNFPWPECRSDLQIANSDSAMTAASRDELRAYQNIETAAQALLDARAVQTNASLADLYDPLTMPANLLKANQVLDKAVDAAYGYKGANTDAALVAFLFERYQKITSLPPIADKPKKARRKI